MKKASGAPTNQPTKHKEKKIGSPLQQQLKKKSEKQSPEGRNQKM